MDHTVISKIRRENTLIPKIGMEHTSIHKIGMDHTSISKIGIDHNIDPYYWNGLHLDYKLEWTTTRSLKLELNTPRSQKNGNGPHLDPSKLEWTTPRSLNWNGTQIDP